MEDEWIGSRRSRVAVLAWQVRPSVLICVWNLEGIMRAFRSHYQRRNLLPGRRAPGARYGSAYL
jgi:hypothetical protein